jgi:hypothetical protein
VALAFFLYDEINGRGQISGGAALKKLASAPVILQFGQALS